MTVPLRVGEQAPGFRLKSQHGVDVALAEMLERTAVLVVFYPFAFSRICTGELTALTAEPERFCNDRVETVAVSCDAMFALRAWSDAEAIDLPLLSDFWPHGAVARSYGVFDESAGMAVRGTFLVARDGRIAWTQINGPGEARDFRGFDAAVSGL